jgi:hypothetical protein
MPKRIAVNTIILHRDGKIVRYKPGSTVDLSAEELESLKKANPDCVREPVNETAPANVTKPAGKKAGEDSAKSEEM